jgi:hypothetical protein
MLTALEFRVEYAQAFLPRMERKARFKNKFDLAA